METENSEIFALTFEFIEAFYNQFLELTISLKNIENFLTDNTIASKPFLKTLSKSNEISNIYQKLKNLAGYHPTSQEIRQSCNNNNKANLRYERNTSKLQSEDLKETKNYNNQLFENINTYDSSLHKIKENFEIDASNRSNNNKLGLRFKSNKLETPSDNNINNSGNKTKTKQENMHQAIDLEKILFFDKKTSNVNNIRGSLDSSQLKSYGVESLNFGYNNECDPRYLDIITLNDRGKNDNKSENNLNISENLTENMNDTMTKLSAREERAIINETLKKEYKCEFKQLADSKTFKNEHQFYIINSKWLRLWTEYVNLDSDATESKNISINSYKNTYRPTVINNIEIIKYQTDTLNINNFYELKENLLEHYDFAALPKKIYKLFKKWYDIDFEVIRYLRPDPTQNNKMVLELYPEKNNNKNSQPKINKKNRVLNNLILKNYKSHMQNNEKKSNTFIKQDFIIGNSNNFENNQPNSKNCHIF